MSYKDLIAHCDTVTVKWLPWNLSKISGGAKGPAASKRFAAGSRPQPGVPIGDIHFGLGHPQ